VRAYMRTHYLRMMPARQVTCCVRNEIAQPQVDATRSMTSQRGYNRAERIFHRARIA
jgi:hypothetical protein